MVMRFGHGRPSCCYFYPFYGYAQVLRCWIELWREVIGRVIAPFSSLTSHRESRARARGPAGLRTHSLGDVQRYQKVMCKVICG